MFDFFSKKKKVPVEAEIDEEAIAVLYLLVEAATVDEVFEDKEKKIICKIIQKQFNIKDENLVKKTILKATEELNQSGDLVSHTKKIKNSWSLEKRKEIIEMLWKVCLIDKKLDPYEDMLIRKISSLLYVDAKDSSDAKQKVLKSLEI